MQRALADIRNLPFMEAKKRALSALEKPDRFECVRMPLTEPLSDSLPGSIRDLFSVFASIRAVEPLLSREKIGPSKYRHGFIRIGTSVDSTELVIRPGEDQIYEIDGSSEADEREIKEGGNPSVYHWILAAEETFFEK
jgi:hypothetical protein